MDFDYRTGFASYPDAEPESPATKAPYIDHGIDRVDPERKSHYRAISLGLPAGGTQEMVVNPGWFGPEAVALPGWDGAMRPAKIIPQKFEDFRSVLAQGSVCVPEVRNGLQSMAFGGYVLSEPRCRLLHTLAKIDRLTGRA